MNIFLHRLYSNKINLQVNHLIIWNYNEGHLNKEIEYYNASTGAVEPRGMTGDPSLPVVLVSPNTQTVRENQTATFHCSAFGNPHPTVTWTRVNGSLRDGSVKVIGHGRRLDIIHSTFNDSGEYKCTAVNIQGRAKKIVKLIVGGEWLLKINAIFVLHLISIQTGAKSVLT